MDFASSKRFARLFPADRPANLAFDRIATKVKTKEGWNRHARKYMEIYDKKIEIEYALSESESENGSGPKRQKRSIWRGCYQLDFDLPPRDPDQGWVLGGGKFGSDEESPDLVLTERKALDCVHDHHARLSHSYSSGALLLQLEDNSSAIVDGKEVRNSIVMWSMDTLITFGTLSYKLILDRADNNIHRHRLGLYQQTHNLGMQIYPVNLLSTPADSDYILKNYVVKNPVTYGNSLTTSTFAAVHLKTSAVVAIKRIIVNRNTAGDTLRETEMATFLDRHRCLYQVVDKMIPDRAFANFDEVYLVYSPLVLTTWNDLCNPGPINDAHNTLCTHLFWQCLQGIAYIHSKGVMHRDIKPDNLTIISFNPPQSRVANFRSSKVCMSSDEVNIGTKGYSAPEMWRITRTYAPSDLESYDNKIDIFAFGLSACQIFCRQPRFWDEEADTKTVAEMKGKIRAQKGAPLSVKRLIRSMLVDDADLRTSAEIALRAHGVLNVPGNQGE